MNTNNKIKIEYLKSLSDNKILIWVDNNYKISLRTIIQKILINYKGLPLSWEDIYYQFLYTVPNAVKIYNPSVDITLKTFLGVKCKYFTLNKCKVFSSNKHKVLNTYANFDTLPQTIRLKDSKPFQTPIDTSMLTEQELLIYNHYFLDGESQSQIEREFGITRYKVKEIIKTVKLKLLVQIKN